jgi:hypothetical protein
MYDKVEPIASKLKVYDGGRRSNLEYYQEAAKIYDNEQRASQSNTSIQAEQQAQQQAEAVKQAELQRVNADIVARNAEKERSKKRQSAAIPAKGAGTKATTDYLDDSDEGFEEWYAALQDKM